MPEVPGGDIAHATSDFLAKGPSSRMSPDYRLHQTNRSGEIRTLDLLVPKQARYQLRHAP